MENTFEYGFLFMGLYTFLDLFLKEIYVSVNMHAEKIKNCTTEDDKNNIVVENSLPVV